MFTKTYRTLHARFDASGLGAAFAPRKPRHPLVRIAVALLGVALLAVLLVVGVFVGVAMLVGGGLWKLLHRRPRATAPARTIDGEFHAVRKPLLR